MTAFWIAAIGIMGTLGAAVLTQWFQGRTAERQGRDADRRRLVDLRREALAIFADALMTYRRSQLQNWHVAAERLIDQDRTDVAAEVRENRARTWAAFYRVQLLWPHQPVVDGARNLVEAVTDLKRLESETDLAESADQVRDDLSRLVDQARDSLVADLR